MGQTAGLFDELRRWLSTVPSRVDYEHDDHSISRQEFLDKIGTLTSPAATILIYLQDRDAAEHTFLTLAYAAGLKLDYDHLPKRIDLGPPTRTPITLGRLKETGLISYGITRDFGEPLLYGLSDVRHPIPNKVILAPDEIGLAVVYLPREIEATSLLKTQLQIAWRLFAVEAARSRQQRLSFAITRMLESIATSAPMDTLCSILAKYCRSHSLYLYQREGDQYTLGGYHHPPRSRRKSPTDRLDVAEVSDLLRPEELLRSHVSQANLPPSLASFAGKSAWMLIPCFTDGVNILSGTATRYPQYLLFLIDKENTEYLGHDYSFTDMVVGRHLASLLSNHLPYMGLSEVLSELAKELDDRPLGAFDLAWFANLAKAFLPALYGIAVLPDFPGFDGVKFEPTEFLIETETIRSSDTLRGNEACIGVSERGTDLNCMIFRIATEYQMEQRVVFAFTDKYLQNAQSQVLNVLVEYIRSAFSVKDFREYHNATQAQIRHVIRGSLSAAISELDLVSSRIRLFAGMPTKLSRLFETPTMRDSVSDTLLWLTEAYALADAPRYLLGSFDKSSVRWSDVDPAALVKSVLAIANGEIRRRGLRVEFDGTSHGHLISADPEFLKILIFNLVDNAIKYSYQDKWLRIQLMYKERTWRFEVENIGVPINSEDRERIFDPWVRSFRQYLATRRPGTGLGLAVSHRILKAHDAEAVFDFTSDVVGEKPLTARTTFFFELDIKGKGEVTP